VCDHVRMPSLFRPRGASPLGLALTAFEIWRRLPPRQRRLMLESARKHGPRIATAAAKRAARARPRREPPRP
jgi:hypothetical protein